MEHYDAIIIGAGVSGLTCGALLAKRGLKVALLEAHSKPGGSCGIFKRNGAIFEQGAAMLYGFNETGFNPHRFVFNVLEEPITMVKHKALYAVHFGSERIIFHEDVDAFIKELVRVFPDEEKGLHAFYQDMGDLYQKVIAQTPCFIPPDVVPKEQSFAQFKQHPFSYIKFLSYLNKNVKSLLRKYFKGEKILEFFDKMTSTYCYATVEEAPAVLGSVMFVDNHYGGSYYPGGSTLHLVGKLEKVIETNKGDCYYNQKVTRILVKEGAAYGVTTHTGETYFSNHIVYGGNIWSLYDTLLKDEVSPKTLKWAQSLAPTYPSVVFFAQVEKSVIPKDTLPIEMFITEKSHIAESELTMYLLSLDDETLCPPDAHVLVAIGPSFKKWPHSDESAYHSPSYEVQKEEEIERILQIFEKRFPGFSKHLCHVELATPSSLERYILKHEGAVAGPKQMLGQHMLRRQHTLTSIKGLVCCGEGTVMGTGTPAVTVSGIGAAHVILEQLGLQPYSSKDCKADYVTIVPPPFKQEQLHMSTVKEEDDLAHLALKCQFCEQPRCEQGCPIHMPISGILRRMAVGNFVGAYRQLPEGHFPCLSCSKCECMSSCITSTQEYPVPIHALLKGLNE